MAYIHPSIKAKQNRKRIFLAIISLALIICGLIYWQMREHTTVRKLDHIINKINYNQMTEAQFKQGNDLFLANCAECHGNNLEGQPNWRYPKADGTLLPPPLDIDGHAWHHSDDYIYDMIHDGGQVVLDRLVDRHPPSNMPPFGDKLKPEDIWFIINYIKSSWSSEIRRNQAAMAG